MLTLGTRHSNTALPVGSKLTLSSVFSTKDLVLNGGALNTGISAHASLLPEHQDLLAHSTVCGRVCVCMCVYSAV